MKLNKVMALALSGLMAVSMLAGCSNGTPNGEENGEQPPVTDNTIVSELNTKLDDAKVDFITFNYSNELQAAAEQVLRVEGGLKTTTNHASNLESMIANYMDFDGIKIGGLNPAIPVTGAKTAITVKFKSGVTAEQAAKDMAAQIVNDIASSTLEEKEDVPNNSGMEYHYTYTGEVAVVSAVDNGTPVYMAVATVACTTSSPVEK